MKKYDTWDNDITYMFYWNVKIHVTVCILLRIKFNVKIRIQFGFNLDLKRIYNTNNTQYS